MGDPDNLGVSFGNLPLIIPEAEIRVLPVQNGRHVVSGVGVSRPTLDMVPLTYATLKT